MTTIDQTTTTTENQIADAIISEMTATKASKGRDYNRPPFRSELFHDLSTVQFPLQWTNPTNQEVITYENKFGNMKKGDMISFELNPNNVNTMGVGEVLGFKIQTNGFWIRYTGFSKKPYWKNLNLFKAQATKAEIKEFNQARAEYLKAQEEAKNAKTEEPTTEAK